MTPLAWWCCEEKWGVGAATRETASDPDLAADRLFGLPEF